MNTATNNTQSLEDILRCYSGRRLQFAIKLGILPQPENLTKLLNRKASNWTHSFQISTLIN